MTERADALFREVYRDHLGLMAKTARAFTVSAVDRDELLQEIMVSVWQALPQFKAQAKLSTYVYRVAHSTALNWKRSHQRYQRKLGHYSFAIPALAAVPEDQERIAWLYACIHQLPPLDRTLVLLYLDKIDYAEMAEITGLTETNIGVRLHRIKQQLATQSEELAQ